MGVEEVERQWADRGLECLNNAGDLSRTQKSSNQNLLYQEMSTRSGSNLVLRVPINFIVTLFITYTSLLYP